MCRYPRHCTGSGKRRRFETMPRSYERKCNASRLAAATAAANERVRRSAVQVGNKHGDLHDRTDGLRQNTIQSLFVSRNVGGGAVIPGPFSGSAMMEILDPSGSDR